MIHQDFRAAGSARLSWLFIGLDRSGHWVVKDARSLCSGLFTNRTEAIRFAMYECQRRPQSVIMLPNGLELDGPLDESHPSVPTNGRAAYEAPNPGSGRTKKCRSQEASGAAGAEGLSMASLPADEDYARSVLAIFGLKNLRLRESLAVSDAKAAFLCQNMGRPSDFDAALEHAASEGWLTRSFDRIRLTTLGAEEMRTVSWPLRGGRPLSTSPRILGQRL
jgi:hypothetical protein